MAHIISKQENDYLVSQSTFSYNQLLPIIILVVL